MKALALTVALMTAGSAQAGVVYNWQTVDTLGNTTTLNGRIEITDNAWRSGHIDHEYTATCPPNCYDLDPSRGLDLSDPSSPVISFAFAVDGLEHESFDINYLRGTGFWAYSGNHFDGITVGRTIDGSINAGTGEKGVGMESLDGIWTITTFSSDRVYAPCRDASTSDVDPDALSRCSGMTGRWMLDASTVPNLAQLPTPSQVPLPGTLALLGIGLLAIAKRRTTA